MNADQRDPDAQEIYADGRTPLSRDPMTAGAKRRSSAVPSSRRQSRRRARIIAAALVTALTALTLLTAATVGHEPQAANRNTSNPATADPDTDSPPVAAQPVDPRQLGTLPRATTEATVVAAPRDTDPTRAPSGRVIHPTTTVPGYATPGGPPIVAVPPTQIAGSDTWLPVIAEENGWVQVLLPVRPNGSAAWLALTDQLASARSPYTILVDRAHFTLTLQRDGTPVGHWIVGLGQPHAPTPPGRAFILAAIVEEHPTYSPLILPTSFHSDTYETYGGGVGTVGIHGWPDPRVFGTASSAGCIRVPDDALHRLATDVPIGTPVLIT